jgi:hypothetical protein
MKVNLSQINTLPVRLKLVSFITTMRAQHCSTSPRYRLKSIFYHYFVVLFAIPGRVDLGSEVEVNVYPIGPKGIQSDSNPAIGKAMVAQ